jgi:hypothetical protein
MCECKETDVRVSLNNSSLTGGEGQGSRGETCHPIYRESPVSSVAEHPLLFVHTKLEEVLKTKHYVSCKMLWDISNLSKLVIPRMLTQEQCESHTMVSSELINMGG